MLWTEWGQSAALIIAMAAIAHVVYSFTRLFRMEAVEHRIRICEANKTGIDWRKHYQSQLSQLSWNNILLRSPFGKIDLAIAHGLFVDDSALDSNTKIQITMTEEERDALWDEMLGAFRLNDKVGVKDCFARGVSMDRRDQHDEYPIHMAARLGDISILKQTHLPSSIDRLWSRNKAGDTPLQVAFSVNKLELIQWLLEEYTKYLHDQVLGHLARKAVCDLAKNAIDAEREDTLKIITDALPRWWDQTIQDADGQPHGFLVTALMQGRITSAVFLSKRLDQPFEPSSYDLDDFYRLARLSHNGRTTGINLIKRLIKHTPGILDLKHSLCFHQYSRTFSLSYILCRALSEPHSELITNLLSSKLDLPLYFIDTVLTLPGLATGVTKTYLMQRGALDWSEFWNDLNLRNSERIKTWMEETVKAGTCVRMLQTSSPFHPLAVEYVLNWKAGKRHRQPPMHVLQLMKDYGASVHDPYYKVGSSSIIHRSLDIDHPFVLASCCQKPVKRMVLDMALAQENRESLPGWSIWTICDIIYFTEFRSAKEYRVVEDDIWYLHCLELLLLETGPQAYKKRRTARDDETPFQYLSKKQKDSETRKENDWKPDYWILKEAIQLLRPWEDIHVGKRSAPPVMPEHPSWKSFAEWEDTWAKRDTDMDSEYDRSDEEQLLLSQYNGLDNSGHDKDGRCFARIQREGVHFRARMMEERKK